MKIILQEMKKIFRPVNVIILVVFTVMFMYSFIIAGPFTMVTTMHEPSDVVKTGKDIIELAGPTLENDEIDYVYNTLSTRYIKEINEHIAGNEIFKAANVYDYEDYYRLWGKITYSYYDAEEIDMMEPIGDDSVIIINNFPPYDKNKDYTLTQAEEYIRDVDFFGSLVGSIDQKLDYINGANIYGSSENIFVYNISRYEDGIKQYFAVRNQTAYEKAFTEELFEKEEWRSIMPEPIAQSVAYVLFAMLILIVITSCFLFGPLLMRDRMTNVTYLQYSGKHGRKVLNHQLAAMLISIFIIVTIEIVFVAILFITNAWGPFLDIKLNSFLSGWNIFMFRGTLGEYLLIITCMIYLVAFACTFIVFVLSKITKNYISMLLLIIPWAAISLLISAVVSAEPFNIHSMTSSFYGILYAITKVPFIEVYVSAAMFIIGMIICIIVLRRNRTADIE